MEELIGKIVKEEFESTKKRILSEFESTEKRIFSRIEGIFKDWNQISAQRNMKLLFVNRISPIILTGGEIKGEDENPLAVALVDESTANLVNVGPESSATVEILLLKGAPNASERDDWTLEKFNENIVREVEERKPLLAGNKLVKLQNGIGFVENIKLRHHATEVRPLVFQLGARVVDTFDGVRIKEAKTESFDVKGYRNKYYGKHKIPSLSDKVSRLVNIRKGGNIEKLLQAHKIHTVEDLLIRHLIDPKGLKSIVNLATKKWKFTVENALACQSDTRVYFYMNDEKTMGVVFNILGQILGLYMQTQCTPTNMLSEKHKANAEELLKSACKHWEKVEPFDGEDSLQQYFNGLDCPISGREDPQTSEMIGESSNRSNFPLSAMKSISETGVKDFSSFGIDDAEIMHDHFYNFDFVKNLFSDIDEFINRNDNRDRDFDGLINELNAGEFVESEDVGYLLSHRGGGENYSVYQNGFLSEKRCLSKEFITEGSRKMVKLG